MRLEKGVVMSEEKTTFDVQDLDELARLVVKAKTDELLESVLSGTRPTTRLVNLTALEGKIYRAKEALNG